MILPPACILSAGQRSGGKLAAHALWYCALSRGHRNFTSFSQSHAATKQHQNTLRLMMEGLGLTTYPGKAASAANMAEFFK
jgi:hypothetical protein